MLWKFTRTEYNQEVNDKSFGDGDNRQSFIWRSETLASAPGSVPANGYTTINMTDMTPPLATVSVADNDQVDPYFYTWHEEEWWDTDDQGGTGGLGMSNVGIEGNGGQLKLRQLPAKRGLCIWGNKADEESIGLMINYVRNTFSQADNIVDYNSGTDGNDNVGSSYTDRRIGPFIRQNGGSSNHVALGAHMIVWRDAEEHTAGASTSASSGVKRIIMNNSDASITSTFTQTQTGQPPDTQDVATITWTGDGANWEDAHAVNTVSPTTTTSVYPNGISVAFGKNIQWWDLLTVGTQYTSASDKDGLFFLNNSIDSEIHTPAEGKPGPVRPASQGWNYKRSSTASFSWMAVTFPDSFTMRYLDADSNDGTAWTEWALQSTVKVTVANTGLSDLDQNNVHPGADLNDSNDPPDYDEDSDYYKNLYKISLMLDGYQETILSETVYTNGSTNPNKNGHKITVEVLADKLGKRMSHINIYRGRAWDSAATSPDLDYQLLERVKLDGAGWKASANGYVKYEVIDNQGKHFGSYEALTGLSPEMTTNYLNYGESEQCAGYLFVANANNAEIANVGNYVFRSKPGKFSIFNWANEYVALPERPTALKAYNNMLFAFSSSKIYTINPNNLSIVDITDGMGCLNAKSIIATDFGMFFADKNGVYLHNGRKGAVISTPIQTSDNSSLTNFTWDSISTSLETSPPKLGFDGQRKALLVVFDVSGASYAWVFSVGTKRWDLWSFASPITSLTQGKYGDVIASDGKLAQLGTATSRKPWEFVSKKITAGLDTYEKSFTEVHVEGSGGLETKYK